MIFIPIFFLIDNAMKNYENYIEGEFAKNPVRGELQLMIFVKNGRFQAENQG